MTLPGGGAALLVTGQTTQYGGYADDGSLEKGVAKSYTVLSTGQYSGTVNITLNAKTDAHSNNCVIDNNTGLMWSRYKSASLGAGSDGQVPWTTNGSGEGIFAYVAAANAASLAGFTDWRIPNLYELLSIADYEAATSAPDANWASFGTPVVWTSTTAPATVANALALDFATGLVSSVVKTTAYYVLLVRGGAVTTNLSTSRANIRAALRRMLVDAAAGKFADVITGTALNNLNLNDCINRAIWKAAPYILRPTAENLTIQASTLTYTLSDTRGEWIEQITLSSLESGYPPTVLDAQMWRRHQQSDGTSQVVFLQQYTAAQVAYVKGYNAYESLDDDSEVTALDMDFILHYAAARAYETLANEGGASGAEAEMTNWMQYHDAEAQRILYTRVNNPFGPKPPKEGKR